MVLTQEIKDDIDSLSQEDMARLWRFSTAGHKYFRNDEVGDYFEERFNFLGGLSSEISKIIGWDK